jgi:hypothetical protein
LVKAKLAAGVTPATEAVTTYEPTTELAVAVTLACPFASVVAAVADRFADAPEEGAVKVTVTPLTGFANESVTSTCKGTAKGARAVVL